MASTHILDMEHILHISFHYIELSLLDLIIGDLDNLKANPAMFTL